MKDDAKTASPDNAPLRFGRLSNTTGFLVRRLHNLLTGTWTKDTAIVSQGITPVQAGVLILIKENPGVSQSRLLKALEVESATLVRSISRLIDADLIKKIRSSTDKRVYYLHLTERGRVVLEQIENAMEARDRRLTEDVAPEDLLTFHRVARHLIAKRSTGTRSGILDGLLYAGSADTEDGDLYPSK